MHISLFRANDCNAIFKSIVYISLIFFCNIITGSSQNQISFSYTGKVQRWTVPSCVQKIKVEVWGAQGGGSVSCTNNGMVFQSDAGLNSGPGIDRV